MVTKGAAETYKENMPAIINKRVGYTPADDGEQKWIKYSMQADPVTRQRIYKHPHVLPAYNAAALPVASHAANNPAILSQNWLDVGFMEGETLIFRAFITATSVKG